MLELPPLSLYIHVPWCIRKCPYCDFNSHEITGELPQQEYIDALLKDLFQEKQRVIERPLHSIFIGGGTPSLLDGGAYRRLLDGVRNQFDLVENIEITLEANPGAVEAQRFAAYREAGINRLSLGIQSFDDLQLRRLGRVHDADQARQAIAVAGDAGFENMNLDLMHGLPGQQAGDALRDLQTAIDFRPAHVSWYQLTIEPNTVFYKQPPDLPGDSLVEAIQRQGQQFLRRQGFSRYEVSAYAKAGYASLHNLNYWRFGDYMGIGAGAHGKLSFPEQDRLLRTRKVRQPLQYLKAVTNRDAEVSAIATEDRALEFLMNALRLGKGFSQNQFETRTGLPFSTIAKQVELHIDQGLMAIEDRREDRFYTTSKTGYLVLNSLLEGFL